jgi:dephospho-CoA kinase
VLRIGLTGGIGSGKTTVANYFSELGIEIIDADEIVHELSSPGHTCFESIIHHFGEDVLNADGSINRQALAQQVFNNETERKILEGILHPAVRLSMHKAVENVQSSYCILVIPLLAETGFNDLVDHVLLVTADNKKRIQWISERSDLDIKQIESVMATQASDDERKNIADDIIENNGSLESLQLQVEKLDKVYREKAKYFDLEPGT